MEYIFSLEFIYLIASVTYILGLKMLGRPETARRGNIIAATGMTLAILGTLFLYKNDVSPSFGNTGNTLQKIATTWNDAIGLAQQW